MFDSVWPHRRQPTRLPRPWDSPGKNTGVGCHFLLQYMKVKSEREVAQSCPTSATPWTTRSLPGSSVHGIFQARVLEWGAIAFSIDILTYWLFPACFSSHVWLGFFFKLSSTNHPDYSIKTLHKSSFPLSLSLKTNKQTLFQQLSEIIQIPQSFWQLSLHDLTHGPSFQEIFLSGHNGLLIISADSLYSQTNVSQTYPP